MKEFNRAHRMHRVGSVEILDPRSIGKIQVIIVPSDLRVFVGDPGVDADAIAVTSLDHERTRRHEVGHFTVVETIPEVKFGHFIVNRINVSEWLVAATHFPDPLVEIAGTD